MWCATEGAAEEASRQLSRPSPTGHLLRGCRLSCYARCGEAAYTFVADEDPVGRVEAATRVRPRAWCRGRLPSQVRVAEGSRAPYAFERCCTPTCGAQSSVASVSGEHRPSGPQTHGCSPRCVSMTTASGIVSSWSFEGSRPAPECAEITMWSFNPSRPLSDRSECVPWLRMQ